MPVYHNGIKYIGAYHNGQKMNEYMDNTKIFNYTKSVTVDFQTQFYYSESINNHNINFGLGNNNDYTYNLMIPNDLSSISFWQVLFYGATIPANYEVEPSVTSASYNTNQEIDVPIVPNYYTLGVKFRNVQNPNESGGDYYISMRANTLFDLRTLTRVTGYTSLYSDGWEMTSDDNNTMQRTMPFSNEILYLDIQPISSSVPQNSIHPYVIDFIDSNHNLVKTINVFGHTGQTVDVTSLLPSGYTFNPTFSANPVVVPSQASIYNVYVVSTNNTNTNVTPTPSTPTTMTRTVVFTTHPDPENMNYTPNDLSGVVMQNGNPIVSSMTANEGTTGTLSGTFINNAPMPPQGYYYANNYNIIHFTPDFQNKILYLGVTTTPGEPVG